MKKTLGTVLVVEDNPLAREYLVKYINKLSYDTKEASNGYDGYKAFLDNNPDIVISDIEMPKCNGIEMVKNIRKVNSEVKIFLVTAFASKENLLDAVTLKLDGFIQKPVTDSALRMALNQFSSAENKKNFVLSHEGQMVYSYEKKCLLKNDRVVSLTNLEIELLELLIKYIDGAVSYETIEHALYEAPPSRNAISTLIKKVRTKLDDVVIESIQNYGYKLLGEPIANQ